MRLALSSITLSKPQSTPALSALPAGATARTAPTSPTATSPAPTDSLALGGITIRMAILLGRDGAGRHRLSLSRAVARDRVTRRTAAGKGGRKPRSITPVPRCGGPWHRRGAALDDSAKARLVARMKQFLATDRAARRVSLGRTPAVGP